MKDSKPVTVAIFAGLLLSAVLLPPQPANNRHRDNNAVITIVNRFFKSRKYDFL